ncbi:MAG: hypothetical protein Q9209_003843 [Squamulea sp. 1 TL-2023]
MGYLLPAPLISTIAQSARTKLEITYRNIICTPWGMLPDSPPYGPDFLPYDDLYECWHTLMPHSGTRDAFNLRYLKDILPAKGYNPRVEPKNFWQLYLNHIDLMYDKDPNGMDNDERKLVESERRASEARVYEDEDQTRRWNRANVESVLQSLENDLHDGRLVLPAGSKEDEETEASYESDGVMLCTRYNTAQIAEDATDSEGEDDDEEILDEALIDEITDRIDSDDEPMASDQVRGNRDDKDVGCKDLNDKAVVTDEVESDVSDASIADGQGAENLSCME